jgi:hypothetical protein
MITRTEGVLGRVTHRLPPSTTPTLGGRAGLTRDIRRPEVSIRAFHSALQHPQPRLPRIAANQISGTRSAIGERPIITGAT